MLVWTWIPTACLICAISSETSYHVRAFLFSLPKHSAPPVILRSLKASISLWIRSMWCWWVCQLCCSESSSSPVQMSSPSCFVFQPKHSVAMLLGRTGVPNSTWFQVGFHNSSYCCWLPATSSEALTPCLAVPVALVSPLRSLAFGLYLPFDNFLFFLLSSLCFRLKVSPGLV